MDNEQSPESTAQNQGAADGMSAASSFEAPSETEAEETSRLPFHVVGIGASAGGVEALVEFFEHLQPDTGMAYVVVSHLMPQQKSHLTEILARHTPMKVTEVTGQTKAEPDEVFLIPPASALKLQNGSLQLEPYQRVERQRLIDQFFFSLAAEQRNKAIAVVLSGMDSDGTLGLRAVKGEGGITMVQAPETAQFPDMPRNGLSLDHVDIVAPPSGLAAQLNQLGRQLRQTDLRLLEDGRSSAGDEQHLRRILALMRGVSGIDFRLYKPSTIRRRLGRRMLLHRIDTLRGYVGFLQGNPTELRELQDDALINVTRFFRDPDVFEAIKNSVLRYIFEGRDPTQQVRVWVAGCSTGEEVYSLAICLLEFMTGTSSEPPIQIFGTDASTSNIQKARAGLYSDAITHDVSPERLRRFFSRTEKGYTVAKRVRDLCIFAQQNLCQDPPFSRMDMISCRNVLIYFGNDLQRELIPTFHYALKPNGYLVLGTSETVREFTDLFTLLDRRHKIYVRTAANGTRALLDIVPRTLFPEMPGTPQHAPLDGWGDLELQRAADRILLARYAPPSVVVNERLEILQTRGRTSPFLELGPGAATLELMRMTRDSIAPQVSSALRKAIDADLPVQVEGLRVTDGEGAREATLEVLPIHSVGQRTKCYLVVFAPGRVPEKHVAAPSTLDVSTEDRDSMMARLREELSSTRLYLQSLLEEREAKNQELVSANEEIQSANEELQSTNEELETTKEELQSSNEELHTVNDELQNRNSVLTQASNDLQNLLNSVNLPVLMLSNDLAIRNFTPPTQRVMSVRSSDVGRPFSELRINLNVQDLTPLLNEVLETLTAREIEVQDGEGHWYLLRVRPYRTADNKIEGLVVALVDIDQLRRIQQELRAARDFARSVIQGVPLPLAVVDFELKIRITNEAFCHLTRMSSSDLERRFLPSLAGNLWGLQAKFKETLEALRDSHTTGQRFEFEYTTPVEPAQVFCIRGCVLQPDQEQFLLVTVEDMTSHKEAERLLKAEKERLAKEVEVKTQALGRSQDELRALAMSLFTSQEEERRRIARELHDDVCQRLASMQIEVEQIRSSANADKLREIDRLRSSLTQLSQDVRTISHGLHPSILEDLGLRPALQSLTEEFGRQEDMIATFFSQDTPEPIPLEIATALYRITQEALRNVAKHAGKTHVRVSLKGTDHSLQLQIADFGSGFDTAGSKRKGLGLVSMEERARHVGATLTVHSGLGEGTRVTVSVPVPETT